jgi:putative membrane-bound dehydrogenase-like protein
MTFAGEAVRLPSVISATALALLVLCGPLASEEAQPDADDEPQIKRLVPKEPAEAAKTFSVQHGFHMDLLAHEPLLRDPVAIAYDENGLMYAVEMTAYPHPEKATDKVFGRVRLLSDDDGDGDFDSSAVFANKLSTPTSVICWRGGVFVTAPPDIWYLKDTDGDRKADVREKIYTGLGINNAEQLANNMKWGIDNKIYVATSHSGGSIRPADNPDAEPVSISGRDFRFDPMTGDVEPLSWATSRWGNSFDDNYNRFVCQNTGPARHVVLPLRYLARNPYLRVESVYQSLAKEVGTEPVYRTSPPEPWRLVRAHRRQALGKPANPGEINATGYFTASCGITIYRGSAYPKEMRGNLFVGDAAGNLVHRRSLVPNEVTFDSRRLDENAEFIASSDNFFRPVNSVNAPDGTLHIVDMYREVVEGPSWVPEDLKEQGLVDVHGGSKQGRIYRLSPPDFEIPKPPRVGHASTKELVAYLENANSWWRETAQRLLVERQDKSAVEPLQSMLRKSDVTLGRLHAMWTLVGLDALSDEDLLAAISDSEAPVREHAIRGAEPRVKQNDLLLSKLFELSQDEAPRVRFQVACSLGQLEDPRAVKHLAHIALTDLDSSWTRTAVLSSATDRADRLLVSLLNKPRFVNSENGIKLLNELASMVGSQGKKTAVERAVAGIANSLPAEGSPTVKIGLMASLFDGRRLQRPVSATTLIAKLLPDAKRIALDRDASAESRANAITLLALANTGELPILKPLIDTREPVEVQLAAIRALAKSIKFGVAEALLSRWNSTTPEVRGEIVEQLASQEAWALSLLDAVEKKLISGGEINPARRAQFMQHKSESIREKAKKLLAAEALGARDDVIAEYQPALEFDGEAERGKAVFLRECIACHRFGKQGHDIGPNLSGYGRKRLPPESLMAQILDPNREVSSNFVSYIVVLNDGRIVTGMIASQTPSSITLRRDQNMSATVLRKDIDEIKSSGKSLMPEGLEKKIKLQEMADLLEFLNAVNQRI